MSISYSVFPLLYFSVDSRFVLAVQYYESHAIIPASASRCVCVWIVGVFVEAKWNITTTSYIVHTLTHTQPAAMSTAAGSSSGQAWLIIGPFNLAFSAIRLSASATTTPWGYHHHHSRYLVGWRTYCIAPVLFFLFLFYFPIPQLTFHPFPPHFRVGWGPPSPIGRLAPAMQSRRHTTESESPRLSAPAKKFWFNVFLIPFSFRLSFYLLNFRF